MRETMCVRSLQRPPGTASTKAVNGATSLSTMRERDQSGVTPLLASLRDGPRQKNTPPGGATGQRPSTGAHE